MREVFEEGEELDDGVLLDDLEADRGGGPVFVDGDHHSAAGDGECGGDAIFHELNPHLQCRNEMTYPSKRTRNPVTATWKSCKSFKLLKEKVRNVLVVATSRSISASASGISGSEFVESMAKAMSFCGLRSMQSSGLPVVGSRTSKSPGSKDFKLA